MCVLVVLPPTWNGPIRTYACHACRMSVSYVLEIDLPRGRRVDRLGR